MKTLFTFVACLLAVLTINAQPYQRSAITTNANLANALVEGIVYVSASSGSDAYASPGPFATLTYAQGIATSGDTIEVLDGTFSETGLGKAGVRWVLHKGVVLAGTPTFTLGTNGLSALDVRGNGTATNTFIGIQLGTNCETYVELDTATMAGTGGLVAFSGACVSNRVNLYTLAVTGYVAGATSPTGSTNNIVKLHGRKNLCVVPMNSTSGDPSLAVELASPYYALFANKALQSSGKTVFNPGRLSREAVTVSTVSNTLFKAVSFTTTNDFPTNLIVNGIYFIEGL
jgi:hypothetical protein